MIATKIFKISYDTDSFEDLSESKLKYTLEDKLNVLFDVTQLFNKHSEWTDEKVALFLKWYLDISEQGEDYYSQMVTKFKENKL